MQNTIKVLQLNIRGILSYENQHRKCYQLNRVLESKQIDVVLIQEWSIKRQRVTKNDPISFPRKYFPNYLTHFHSTECAILYHKGLNATPLDIQNEYLKTNHRENFHICGIIIHSKTTDYGFYSVYRPQIADPNQIFRYKFETDHIIIGGDFNIHHPLWGSKKACKKGSDFLNNLTGSNFLLLNKQSPTRIDPRNKTLTCIDLSLSSHNMSDITWNVDHNSHDPDVSDHYHIYFNIPINIKQEDSIYHTTWNLSSKTKWKKFHSAISKEMKRLIPATNINEHVNQINAIIYDTAISTLGYRKYIKTFKPWRNNEIKMLQKNTKRIKRKLDKIKNKHPDFYNTIPKYNRMLNEYKSLRNIKVHKIRKAKIQYQHNINKFLQNSSFNDNLSWRLIKRNKNKSSNNIPTLSHNNKPITDPIEKTEILHSVLCHPEPPKLDHKHIQFHKYIDQRTKTIIKNVKPIQNPLDILNAPIQYYELKNCIKDLQKDKAFGPDLIHNQMIIKGGKILWKKLLDLFNRCLNSGTYPNLWNYANICPIPKPGKIHNIPKNYRPIAISSCLGRVFEKILAKRLQQFCVKNKTFNNNQCGFQINRATDDILSTFLYDGYSAINKKTSIDCIFTDFSKAYDSVWHNALIYKLRQKYQIKGQFLKCIINFIKNRYTRVVTKTGSSSWKLQTQGLPQGSSLSPILYILFTNDYKIKYKNFVKMGCFADDTAFWTTPSTENTIRPKLLQRELNRFTDWTKFWKMSINPSKCSFITIHKLNTIYPHNKYIIENNVLKRVLKCKYLGLWIDSNLSMKYHISKQKNKLEQHLYHMYFLQNSGLKLYPKTILQIYKSKSRPCIEYASIFYLHKDKNNTLQTLQNKFIRNAYPCRQSTPVHTLNRIANIQPISIRTLKLTLRHFYRAKYSSSHHPIYKLLQKYIKDPLQTKQKQLPFDIAIKIIKNNKSKITINDHIDPINGPITALPKYDIAQIPTNYTINKEPIDINNINQTDCNIYTDGSCKPNPGKGAYGWYAPLYKNKCLKQIQSYKYPITITNCELMAILIALTYIKKNPPYKSTINIFTDCQLALQYLNFDSYPKYNNIKLIVQSILKTLALIQFKNTDKTINFHKVKSHSNIPGNNKIDKMVRHHTKSIKYKEEQYKYIPYPVTLTQIHKFTTKIWKSNWRVQSNPNRWITKCHSKLNNQIHLLINKANLNIHQCGIIIRLITEHIELNKYLFKLKIKCPKLDKIPDSPYCTTCDQIETVNHFINRCKTYKTHRKKLYNKISKINNKYKYKKFQTIKYLLFPYLLHQNSIPKQIMIWKEILNYTKITNRFKNLYRIDINQI